VRGLGEIENNKKRVGNEKRTTKKKKKMSNQEDRNPQHLQTKKKGASR